MLSPLYPDDEGQGGPYVRVATRNSSTSGDTTDRTAQLFFPQIFSTSPQLEIKDFSPQPFSHSFSGLLDLECSDSQDLPSIEENVTNLDTSYNLQHFANIKDLDPEWEHDEIDEIVVMKRKPRLPRISEESALDVNTQPISFSSFEILHSLRDASPQDPATSALGRHLATAKLYTVKIVPLSSETSRCEAHLEQHILEMMQSLNSSFLPHLFWTFEHLDHFYFIMDYHPGGDLLTRINASGKLSVERSRIYASELAAAICVLHDAGIIHGDVRPENVLFNKDGHVVLTNFGQATIHRSAMLSSFQKLAPSQYHSPEVILGWTRDFSVDCWGFGILLHMMLTGTHPFLKASDCGDPAAIRDGALQPLPHHRHAEDFFTDASFDDLIAKCLERNPALRATIHEIQLHRFLSVTRLASGETIKGLWRSSVNSIVSIKEEPSLPTTTKPECHWRLRRRSNFQVNGLGVGWDSSSFSRNCFSDAGPLGDSVKLHADFPLPPSSVESRPLSDAFSQQNESSQDSSEAKPEQESPATVRHPAICDETAKEYLDKKAEEQAARNRFWETISLRQGSNSSAQTLEGPVLKGFSTLPARKLRKWRSCLVSSKLLGSGTGGSTTSKTRKNLLRRPESTPTLSSAKHHPTATLPNGLEQIGSGIAFTYFDPNAARSKVSMCTTPPRTCHTPLLPAGLLAAWTVLRKRGRWLSGKRADTNRRIECHQHVATFASPTPSEPSWDMEVTLPSTLSVAATTPLPLRSPASDVETICFSTPGTLIETEPTRTARCALNSDSTTTLRLVTRDGNSQQVDKVELMTERFI